MLLNRIVPILLILTVAELVSSYKVNITKVVNCKVFDGFVYPFELLNITLMQKDNFTDAVKGTYVVRDNNYSDRDVVIKVFKCPSKNGTLCTDNLEKHKYSYTCEHYLRDIGPWSLLSEATAGPHCSHPIGVFELNHSTFDPIILDGYVDILPKFNHYRFILEFMVQNNQSEESISDYETDIVGLRGCVEMEFDTYF